MRVKGIGVFVRSVLFLSANFEGSLDEGRSSRFRKADWTIPPEDEELAGARPAALVCDADGWGAERLRRVCDSKQEFAPISSRDPSDSLQRQFRQRCCRQKDFSDC